MTGHKRATREEWLAERKKLLEQKKSLPKKVTSLPKAPGATLGASGEEVSI